MYSIYISQTMCKLYSIYPQYYIGQTSSKILGSQQRNSGAKHKYYIYITSINCFIILYVLFWKSMIICNLYYRPDMGWEPVWYGPWIKMAEVTQENLPEYNKA